jgi:iron(III) transport system substrate-binding protein
MFNKRETWQHVSMRTLLFAFMLFLATPTTGAHAEMTEHPAKAGTADDVLTVYSTLDLDLAARLIDAFRNDNPGVAVRYHDLLAGEISARIVAETDGGGTTADFAFSSAMDLQIKLANDGYAQPVDIPAAGDWPQWANWRDTAFALTYEPGVIVWHKPSFPNGPPRARLELLDWLKTPEARGGIGTYDITRSSVGFLYLARDEEHFADIWSLIRAMGIAELKTFATSRDIIDRVASGELKIGYNILGSYADEQSRLNPELGIVLPRDYTVVASRIGLVPRAAARPDLGRRFLEWLMGRKGQSILAEQLRLAAVSLEVRGGNSAAAMEAALGNRLRPVPVSPGLLAYLDQAKRKRILGRWAAALGRP